VPRLGGLGIAVAFYFTVGLLWLLGSTVARATISPETPVGLILLGGVPILLLGIIDDLHGLRALPKLLVQTVVGVALWWSGLRVLGASSLHGSVELYGFVSCAATVLWLVAVINAVNLIDGLDGLASGVVLFALGTTTLAALWRGEHLLALLTGTLMGAVLGFLRYNWAPASIMMGDTGSLFLGYLLAATSIWSVRKSATAVLVVFPVVALGLAAAGHVADDLAAAAGGTTGDAGRSRSCASPPAGAWAAGAKGGAAAVRGVRGVLGTVAGHGAGGADAGAAMSARGGDLCAGPVLRLWLSAAWAEGPVYCAAASASNPAAAAAAAGARTAATSGADPAGARRSGDALCRGDRALAVAAAAVF
jgi:hypothetical protein